MLKKLLFTICLALTPLLSLANTILIVGDSLSAGYGIEPNKGWAALLQQRLNAKKQNHFTVINASTSGDTTQNGLDKLPALLKKYHPEITIIQLGGNDGLRGLSLQKMSENLSTMITLSKQQNSKVLLMGVPMLPNYGRDFIARFQQVFINVAKKNNIAIVNNFVKKIDNHPELMQADGIHPNAKAQQLMLDNTWPTLLNLIDQT